MSDKKTILLINPGHEGRSSLQHIVPHKFHRDIPPVSILTLGSYLERQGLNVILIDTHIDDKYQDTIKKIILNEDLCFVGITTLVGKFISNAMEITKYIKSIDPKLAVVWGGALTSTLPEACLKEGKADYIVLFNGEEPLRLLAKALNDGTPIEDVPNIGFLKDGAPVYTEQFKEQIIYEDVLDWGLLGGNINIKQIPYLAYIFSSRGCPYGCRFCYHQMSTAKNQRKCIFRRAERVLSELDFLNGQYGINVFNFGDDNFFSNKKRAVEILVGMKERGYYIEQAIGTFSDFNDEVISSLKGVCQTIICSIETASEKLLKLINKPIRLEQIPEINHKLNEAGINTIHNFMFGLPSETDEDRKAAVELMIRLKGLNPYVRGMAYFFTPLPGTPMFEDIEKEYGDFPKTLDFWKDCEIVGLEGSYIFRPWLSKSEQLFITEFIDLFKGIFQSINQPLTREQSAIINGSPRLKHIFLGIEDIKYPEDRKPKYLLDEILKSKGVAV